MKIIKWLWKKAEDHAYERCVQELRSRAQYHKLKGEIAILRPNPEYTVLTPWYEKLNGREHFAASDILSYAAAQIAAKAGGEKEAKHNSNQ